jgi:hypothetical protein
MGQIRKRGRIYWIRYYRNGQRIEESADTKVYDEARTLLKDREGDIAKGVPITAASTRFTFDDAVKDVQHDYTVNGKRSTAELDRRIKLHLTPAFGGRKLSAITTSALRAFTSQRLEAGAAAGEINRELAIVRRAFRLAVADDKYHGRVPKFPMLQERNVRSGFFDDAMFAAVKAKLPAACNPSSPSRTSPAGGFRARSCRSSGDTSTGRLARRAWSPAQRRIRRGGCSPSPRRCARS